MARASDPARDRPRLPARHTLTLMLLPAALGVLAFELIPAAITLALAFSDYDTLSAPRWAGLGNFASAIGDPGARRALANTVQFLLFSLPLRLLAGVGAALLLQRDAPWRGLQRAATLAPTLMPEAAYAFAWLWIVNPLYGPLNQALTAVGLPASGWLSDPAAAPRVLVLMALFQAGETFLIALAALRSVPASVHEAAQLDGAGRIARARWVSLPLALPWLGAALLRDAVVLLFYTLPHTRLMTGGGPDLSTLYLPLLTFQQGIEYLRIGRAAALTVVLWLLALVPLALSARWLRRLADA